MLDKIPYPKNIRQWQIVFVLYIILITIVSLTPADSRSLPVKHIDKIGHFLAYTLLAVLALISFKGKNGRITAVLLTFIIAILLEWGQSFVPGRVASLADGLTNFLGLTIGLLLWWLYQRRVQPKP
jgi:VanZ family protein